MLRRLIIILSLSAVAVPCLAQNCPSVHVLGAIDTPISVERVQNCPDLLNEVLMRLDDPNESIYVRSRSIGWLALEGSRQSYDVVANVLRFGSHPVLRRQALISLTRVLVRRFPTLVEALIFETLPSLTDPLFRLAIERWWRPALEPNHHR